MDAICNRPAVLLRQFGLRTLFLNVRQELEVMRAGVSLRRHWLVIELHHT